MIQILFQNEDLAVVEKPSGMLVHPTRIAAQTRGSLMHGLRDQLGHWVYPVHRLDRSASGAIVFGKTSEAATELAALFARREIEKLYWAVVRGIAPERGEIDRPLKRYLDDGSPAPEEEEPQAALTRFERLGSAELPFPLGSFPCVRYSLVEVRIETGRLHQIRRHFHHLAHPLIGDTAYGDGKHNRLWREKFALHRLLLFSRRLAFLWKGSRIDVTCPIPTDVSAVFQGLGWPTA